MFWLLFVALVCLLLTPLAGWVLIVWLIVKLPRLSVSIAVYIGLHVWLGAHDALALASYALILLGIWRLAHKRSFQRFVGRRTRSPQRRSWAHHPPPAHDQRAIKPGEPRPAAPTHPEDPTNQTHTTA